MNLFFNKDEQRTRAGWRVLIQFFLFFFISGFAALAFNALFPSSLSIASAIPQLIGVAVSIILAAYALDKRHLEDYGLSLSPQWWKDLAAGIIIAGFALSVIFLIEWTAGWLIISGYGWTPTSGHSFLWGILSALGAMLLVGFYEEWCFRGYQLLNLTEGLQYPKLGVRGAVTIATLASSAVFGLMHAFNPNSSGIAIFNIMLAGIVLAIPYIITGNLALSIGLHFSWNFVQGGILGFAVSGIRLDASVIQITQKGPIFWTGGVFGPEAGLLGVLGMAIIGGGSYVYIVKSGYERKVAPLFSKRYRANTKSDEQGR
ncbi:CPBP family intramembrane glutamic endopeptidase [Fodinibius salsisoli]|uniref:CPBP family intramembrane metalloprotease n=1 Tax=Fodinibius salsisoli TaxID=2820877 RepID=A0ABT3PRL8_9BACT|nr:CPBP family intramembrane glutamic endopeptidase [Fodinibius salsisoli]MCW9708481.1 CPBP family intramembrane metalloprotease [Fodinibius salsisoli]